MCAIQILISIIPIWIYLRFMNKQVSYYLGLGKTNPTNKLHNSIFLFVSSQDNTKLWLCYFWDDAAIIDLKSFTLKHIFVDVPFVLKRWWALWCISKKEKTRRSKFKDSDVILNIKKILEPCSDNSKIIMNENVSNM